MMRLRHAFDPPMRRAVASLWLAGLALTLWGAVLAYQHPDAGPWFVFFIPGIGLAVLTVATIRGAPWAFAIDTVVLGGQVIGVIGVLFELSHFDTSEKAAQVRALGADPLLGLLANLIFSAIGVALFARIALRWR